MKTVLFLCTGNYYRSRFAEILFNWKARQRQVAWQAVSRGLAPDPRNAGPISIHTRIALELQGISVQELLRYPVRVTAEDFSAADHVVAVKEAEHRAMIERSFLDWLQKVEFWHVHDLDCSGPEETIADLERNVTALINRLEQNEAHEQPR